MESTRRNFLKTLFIAGGMLFLPQCARNGEVSVTSNTSEAAYITLEKEGLLAERVEQAYALFENCTLCPQRCGVNRNEGEQGICRATSKVVVYSYAPHFGEELPLVGNNGSGTIFFSNCNLRCVFCQNWPIAHAGSGSVISDDKLADMMLGIQKMGCHNINLVTPTHVMPNILNATRIAMQKGLKLPLCYNTGGYELPENIRLLDGIIDIYLPDLKFMDGTEAARYTGGAGDYPEMAQNALIEMHRQVGDLVMDARGIATRGLMVRQQFPLP